MKRIVSNKRAFTLIELLVVVLIIGILAAVAVPQYNKAVKKAKSRELLVAFNTYNQAMSIYHLEHGNYCGITADTLGVQMPTLKYFEYYNRGGTFSQDLQLGLEAAYCKRGKLMIYKKGEPDSKPILVADWDSGKLESAACLYSQAVCKEYFDCDWNVNVCYISR